VALVSLVRLLRLLILTFAGLAVCSIPLCVANSRGGYLAKGYNLPNSSSVLDNRGNSSFIDALQIQINVQLMHWRLDSSIFNVDNAEGEYISQFLWSILLLLTVVTMICVLQYSAFIFETMRQKDNAAHHISGHRSIGDVSCILEPMNEATMYNLLERAWGGEGGDQPIQRESSTENAAELAGCGARNVPESGEGVEETEERQTKRARLGAMFDREVDPTTRRSHKLEECVRDMLLLAIRRERGTPEDRECKDNWEGPIRQIFIPLALYEMQFPIIKIFISFQDSRFRDWFSDTRRRDYDCARTLLQMVHLEAVVWHRAIDLSFEPLLPPPRNSPAGAVWSDKTLNRTWYVLHHADPPGNIVYENLYMSFRGRVISAALWFGGWVLVLLLMFAICILFLRLNWQVEEIYKGNPLLILFLQVVVLLTLTLSSRSFLTLTLIAGGSPQHRPAGAHRHRRRPHLQAEFFGEA